MTILSVGKSSEDRLSSLPRRLPIIRSPPDHGRVVFVVFESSVTPRIAYAFNGPIDWKGPGAIGQLFALLVRIAVAGVTVSRCPHAST